MNVEELLELMEETLEEGDRGSFLAVQAHRRCRPYAGHH